MSSSILRLSSRFRPLLAGLLLCGPVGYLGCRAPAEPPTADAPASPDDPEEALGVHGEWKRWAHTPELRDAALRRLEDLPRFSFGEEASPEAIAAWDIDVMPDGTGLPPGSGTVAEGKVLYGQLCFSCHGEEGRGAEWDRLVGREPREGFPFGDDTEQVPTIGNYWPYAPTLFDYTRRAMPLAVPGTLTSDEVYALVAYLLYLNEILPEDAVMDAGSLPRVRMPARDRFVYDDRVGGAGELR